MKPGLREQSNRQLKVSARIKDLLLENMVDLNIELGGVKIRPILTGVEINTDLKRATGFIEMQDVSDKNCEEIMKYMNSNFAGFFKKIMAKSLNIKYVPSIHFILDEGYKDIEKIKTLIDSIKEK